VSIGTGLLKEIIGQFAIYGDFEGLEAFGRGHINRSYRSVWNQAGAKLRYTHQRINEKVFVRPDEVMENIERVTSHTRLELAKNRSDTSRLTLTIIPSQEGKLWLRDSEGGWWRTYLFIEGSHTLELTAALEDARFLGESIARFQAQLANLGGKRLHETIPGFHDMERRYGRFYGALAKDPLGRARQVQPEIAFMETNEERGGVLIRALKNKTIPERACHNDAKINNILIDDASSRALCVIDLDTVMPGTVLFDLGDLIRTVTNKAAEDERDLSKVDFDLCFFRALLNGYLSSAGEFLVPGERELLFESGRCVTQIMGLRFLTDYLEGDHYYRVARPDHNLDRCRTQIALIESMDKKQEEALKIIDEELTLFQN
jgi:hypothetical protein